MRFKVTRNDETITLVSQPTAKVISVPRFNSPAFSEFMYEIGIADKTYDVNTSSGARVCEVAGRLCYLSFDKPRPGGIQAYIENILSSGHGSVLEHANVSIAIAGVSRSLTHEFVRHRAGWGYSQLSQRYVDDTHLAFVIPPRLLKGIAAAMTLDVAKLTRKEKPRFEPATNAVANIAGWSRGVEDEDMSEGYDWLADRFSNAREYRRTADYLFNKMSGTEFDNLEKTEKRKIARQTARNCLPNCTETMLIATANVRALRHFISMRGSKHADEEIRSMTRGIAGEVRAIMPELFSDIVVDETCSPPGIGLKYPKV